MLLLLGISLLLALLLRTQAPLASASLVNRAHQLCIDACPPSIHREFLNAIVCGEPLAGGSTITLFKNDFVKTGLIHLLVVSGSHLICLEEIAAKFRITKIPKLVRSASVFCTLLVFTLMTSASPPVLRSMIQWCLRRLSVREGWNWTRTQTLTVSGAVALIFCKDSLALKSLFLSWIAALGLGWIEFHWQQSTTEKIWTSLKANAAVYLTLCPALLPLGVPHPFSIVCNFLFAPVMGLLLFPLSMLGYLWSGFSWLADLAWSMALWLVSRTADQMPTALEKMAFSQVVLVPYVFGLTFLFCFARGRRRRRKISAAGFFRLPVIALALLIPMLSHADELVVWNVGQGSWATVIVANRCLHFDMGGEHAPLKTIRESCSAKVNQVYFSHWDWDHIEQTKAAVSRLRNLCVAAAPGGETKSKTKLQMLSLIGTCSDSNSVSEISRRSVRSKSANELSRIFVFKRIIFPGDSTSSAEKMWDRSPIVSFARVLIAGHHGSKTSTSSDLLNHAKALKMVVVSARKEKYGHPHPLMLARASAHFVSVLTTEDWGSLHFELSSESRRRR